MTHLNRRTFGLGLAATGGLAACGNGTRSSGAPRIDARADVTLREMQQQYPGTSTLVSNAKGMLVMPLITEIGLWVGGGWGRGALRVGRATIDYYSAASASAGLQVGVQQYSHVLFFMTDSALADFRASDGWAIGANVEYALENKGDQFRADTTTSFSPVVAVVFGQAGFRVGATLEGTKYTRIIP
ncbi:MAG: YSC84-related protein [Planktomarina sp.]